MRARPAASAVRMVALQWWRVDIFALVISPRIAEFDYRRVKPGARLLV
jgi:hypothetical protein